MRTQQTRGLAGAAGNLVQILSKKGDVQRVGPLRGPDENRSDVTRVVIRRLEIQKRRAWMGWKESDAHHSSEGPLELENDVPNTRTGVILAAALAIEDHCGARV